jgi:hypothetical protein
MAARGEAKAKGDLAESQRVELERMSATLEEVSKPLT